MTPKEIEIYDKMTDIEVICKWFHTPASRLDAITYLRELKKVLKEVSQ